MADDPNLGNLQKGDLNLIDLMQKSKIPNVKTAPVKLNVEKNNVDKSNKLYVKLNNIIECFKQ